MFNVLLRTLRPDANYAMAGVERGGLRYIVDDWEDFGRNVGEWYSGVVLWILRDMED
jgi:hypothetical protein